MLLPKWHVGLKLLPEHFEALQEALMQQQYSQPNAYYTPHTGFEALHFDANMLISGQLKLLDASYMNTAGECIRLHHNATCQSLNLLAFEHEHLNIYLNFHKPREICRRYGQETLTFAQHALSLSTQPDSTAEQSLKCLELTRQGQGFIISPDFWPMTSSLCIDPAKQLCQNCQSLVEQCIAYLRQQLAESAQLTKNIELKQCLYNALSVMSFFKNLEEGYQQHPFTLYQVLQNLYHQLTLCFNQIPDDIISYQHEHARQKITDLYQRIKQLFEHDAHAINVIKFQRTMAQHLVSEPFSEDIEQAKSHYLVLRHPNQAALASHNLKLASASRIDTVCRLALPGIRLEPCGHFPFEDYFAGACQYYQILPDQEWQHAQNEKQLALYLGDDSIAEDFYLYARTG